MPLSLPNSRSCLDTSNSLSTSSKSNTGYSPNSSFINSSCANLRARAAVRCCPCEPNHRKSLSPSLNAISSLCGPFPVTLFFMSLSQLTLRVLSSFSLSSPSSPSTEGSYIALRVSLPPLHRGTGSPASGRRGPFRISRGT